MRARGGAGRSQSRKNASRWTTRKPWRSITLISAGGSPLVTNQRTPSRSRAGQPHLDGAWVVTPAVRRPSGLTAAAKNSW